MTSLDEMGTHDAILLSMVYPRTQSISKLTAAAVNVTYKCGTGPGSCNFDDVLAAIKVVDMLIAHIGSRIAGCR